MMKTVNILIICFLISGTCTSKPIKSRAHIFLKVGGEFTAQVATIKYNGKKVIPGNSTITCWEGSRKRTLKLNQIDSVILYENREVYKIIYVGDIYDSKSLLASTVYKGKLSLYEVYYMGVGSFPSTGIGPSNYLQIVKSKYYTKKFDNPFSTPFRKKKLVKRFRSSCAEFQTKYDDKENGYMNAKEMIEFYSQNCL